ncbi:hypothetical protein S7711_00585 [Stachybotrys chartarum IBT 7711]|uniref:Pre-mRNA-splicing factor 38B n=1 Tax=Stachybotrys chartarum (strain CBS 109288 / IBT 7711) TaxID=1280523 RepID=A0A084ATT2_STACB|nr:hypothetical protein S7711_00585 [Stachybotrys chartarum IBT 7711]KFA48651.1 hypothetical protein S40293_04503 [Stachybotrys chartarum IBT 40293]
MSNDDILTDDYVAGLLAQEAKDCSIKYSAMGLEAFRRDKKPDNMPKPNTRFLRHIIKDTDSHNQALLAKEAAEARARLAQLNEAEDTKRQRRNPSAHDIRKRQLGDIGSILSGRKRRRAGDDEPVADTNGRATRKTARDKSPTGAKSPSRDDRGHRRRDSAEREHSKRSSRTDGKSSRRRTEGNTDNHGTEHRRHRHEDRRRHRSSSPQSRRRSKSPRRRAQSRRERSPLQSASDDVAEVDSDPLEDLIGPAPPPKYRGRGTLGGAAGIDRRFSESYDPKTDVQMDDEGVGDWDDAVEAFRDRQKLRAHQEERLRAAGFATQQIQKVQGGGDAAEPSFKWSKAGERREWDRSKFAGPSGIFSEQE